MNSSVIRAGAISPSRGGLSFGDVRLYQVGNAAVGLCENNVDQFPAVYLGRCSPDVLVRVLDDIPA